MDDNIFGATNEILCKEFSELMQGEFEMYMMGELKFFVGLQISQRKNGIFISQTKYCKEILKKFGMDLTNEDTPMSLSAKLDANANGKRLSLTHYQGLIGSLLYLNVVELTFNLVLECVLDIRLILKSHI